MVSIRMPPGRSSTTAKSERAPLAIGGGGQDGEFLQGLVERIIRQADPAAEPVLQAQRHFGRRVAGEGEAEDAAGIDPARA